MNVHEECWHDAFAFIDDDTQKPIFSRSKYPWL